MKSENTNQPPVPEPDDIFECQQCGECCKGYGGTYITEKDVQAIADYIKVSPEVFVRDYCQKSGNRLVLAVGDDDYCMFRKDKLCGIHPVKPRMCRAWPYIQNVVRAPENWKAMANSCPGIRTGFTENEIVACVSRVIAAREE